MDKKHLKAFIAQEKELSLSRSLGNEDTFSMAEEESEEDPLSPKSNQSEKVESTKGKAPWVAVNTNREVSGPDYNLEFVEPVEGRAVLEEEELYTIEEEKQFVLLGCFAGRFPGMKSIISLIKTWEIECRAVAKPNGFVILKFLNAKDRDSILNGPVHYLFGKRLFLRLLSEDYQLENCEFCVRPLWIKLPGLPKQFWHPRALSKIASCIGKPICVDKITKTMSKCNYARVLIDVDTSEDQLDSVSIQVGDKIRDQKVEFEYQPIFCPLCCGWDHFSDTCQTLRRRERNRQPPSDQMEDTASHTVSTKNVGREQLDKSSVQRQNSPEQAQSSNTGNTIEQWRKLGKKQNTEGLAFGTLQEGNSIGKSHEQSKPSQDTTHAPRRRNHQEAIDREIKRRKEAIERKRQAHSVKENRNASGNYGNGRGGGHATTSKT